MRKMYPEIEPYNTGELKVSDLHTIYYEECGNPKGKPVVFLHGGPGGGTEPHHRRFFDPKRYRIVLFDQRGCGKSAPYAELRENTTWDLVADIERLRGHLSIEAWVVFGGSWGSTLALAYSQTHPERCKALVLRGIFTLRRKELEWFYQEGTGVIFPELWEKYLAPIPAEERSDMMAAYYKRLTSSDKNIRGKAAQAWATWEAATSRLIMDPKLVDRFSEEDHALAFARIECHYFVNGGWFEPEDQLIRNVDKIRHLPGVIVQGRYDVVCPVKTAWDLHQAWPEAQYTVIPDAGHAVVEPGITDALIQATDKFAEL